MAPTSAVHGLDISVTMARRSFLLTLSSVSITFRTSSSPNCDFALARILSAASSKVSRVLDVFCGRTPDVLDLAVDVVWGVLPEEGGVGELSISVSVAIAQGLNFRM